MRRAPIADDGDATKRRRVDDDDDALLRDAEDARDDDGDDGATTGRRDDATGDDGAEEYADDVDYDEEEVHARTTGRRGRRRRSTCGAADRANWVRRPLARAVDATRDALLFQQLDIDYAVEKPHEGAGGATGEGRRGGGADVRGDERGTQRVRARARVRAVFLRVGAGKLSARRIARRSGDV